MKHDTIRDIVLIVAQLSSTIIEYETGDVMTISSIMDDIENIKDKSKDNQFLELICTALLTLCTAELADSNPQFTKNLSDGLDALKDMLDVDTPNADWKARRAGDWIHTVLPDAVLPALEQTQDLAYLRKSEIIPAGTAVSKKAESAANKKSIIPEVIIDQSQFDSFISDSEERCSRAQELILSLEQDLSNLEYIKELFRIFHTIKGECGFLKLASLGLLAHTMENLLDLLRSQKITADQSVIEYLLNGLDIAKQMLNEISTGSVVIQNKVSLDDYVDSLNAFTSAVKPSVGEMLVQKGFISEKEQKEIIREQINSGFNKKFGEVAVENNIISEEKLETTLKEQKTMPVLEKENIPSPGIKSKQEKADTIIKVKTSKVNYLVDMIGELLIALGQVHDNIPGLAQVRKITRSLQYAGMQLRTESVRMLFGNIRRIVRDTSNKLNKPVRMEFIGEDLEIDRLLIEQLEEPLMHLVRNSLDHGIESPEERTAAGKQAEGLVRVVAERRGNNIVISVSDDGKGIDREKVIQKALAKGLVQEEDSEKLTNTAVYNLLFQPGFSTKDKIDFISGRGVGMDIVKQVVSSARGHIETISEKGKGTTFELIFPLSTAIIDGMTVRAGANIFIIPIAVIIESMKLKTEYINRIRNNVSVLNLRGQMIPIIKLAEVFDIPHAENGMMATIVENTNRERFAIVSDEILSKREIVIKSLGARFRDFRGISSGTVLPGGTIGLVLDVDQVIELGMEQHNYDVSEIAVDSDCSQKQTVLVSAQE